jgi:hypothetical protein
MRTTVDLDTQLLKRLRAEARRRGVSFREVLTGAIRRGLQPADPTDVRPYQVPTFSLGAPRPPFDSDKALAAADALEQDEIARKLALRK